MGVALEVKNITKRYPGVVALDDVSLSFDAGEVHALVGENGAGKSTLIKAISGSMEPDAGTIEIGGESYASLTTRKAQDLGIGTIYQDANLVGDLSVAENVLLGDLPRKHLFVDRTEMYRRTREVLDLLGVELDPAARVADLSTSQAQFVAIARAVAREVSVLIMDEPTAALTDSECEKLFDLVRRLRDQGVCIIFITHRMREVFAIADRISVMRDGRVVTTTLPGEISEDDLIQLIVGRPIEKTYPVRAEASDETVLSVRGLSGDGVHDVSFDLHRGEILGFAGLMGSGRTELARILFGADSKKSGTVTLFGEELRIKSPEGAVRSGLGFVPSDRKGQGVLLEQSVRSNITLSSLRTMSHFFVDQRHEKDVVEDYIDGLKIKTPSIDQLVRNLSGGNQQKVALSKWLVSNSKVLLFDEPTQGVDVGARHEIYRLMNDLTREGISILLLSSDLDELMGMCDRILVMHEGSLVGELDDKNAYSQEEILRLASGLESRKVAA